MLEPLKNDPNIQAELDMIERMLKRMTLTPYEKQIIQRRRDMLLRGWMNINK